MVSAAYSNMKIRRCNYSAARHVVDMPILAASVVASNAGHRLYCASEGEPRRSRHKSRDTIVVVTVISWYTTRKC